MCWTLLIASLVLPTQAAAAVKPLPQESGAEVATLLRSNSFRLVESFPLETSLDAPDLPETAQVWEQMIRGAKKEILLAHFYAATADGSSLNGVIAELKKAAARGVRVRFLLSDRFRKIYPEVPAALDAVDGVEVRFLDFGKVAGGVLHAKYMVVDRERFFLGSPNFDFRAMEHIQELGIEIESSNLAGRMGQLFDEDWCRVTGETPEFDTAMLGAFAAGRGATQVGVLDASQAGEMNAATEVTLGASPPQHLPSTIPWDLPLLLELIDGAKSTLRAQVLTYDATGSYDKDFFSELETALRSAAARGVRVQLLVADWCKREGVVDGIQSLAALDGIDVSFVVIPESSNGFVPFSRVAHAKLCVADERAAWLGTSNWEGSYFTTSRNVSVILEGEAVGRRLAAWFDVTWNSDYREAVVPGQTYVAPRRQ